MDKIVIYYMWKTETCAMIEVEYDTNDTKPTVSLENYTEDVFRRPFGINEKPDYAQFLLMLERRCFPRNRYNCNQLLHDVDMDFYTLVDLVLKTHGVLVDDFNWLRFEEEPIELWESLRKR